MWDGQSGTMIWRVTGLVDWKSDSVPKTMDQDSDRLYFAAVAK